MLAHIYTLSGEKKVKDVLKKGERVQSDLFGVFYLKRSDEETPKFAFVISTKISKLAVHRNRVRRAMGESVRRNVTKLPKGVDFVFLAKRDIVKRTTVEIMKEVENFISSFELKK